MSHFKYKIGTKVIFIKKSYKEDAWPLTDYDEYEIVNLAFDNKAIDKYYAVKNKNGQESTWYLEQDFTTKKELRQKKLLKIKNYNYGN